MVYDLLLLSIYAACVAIAAVSVLAFLFRKKDFNGKYVDIKEAPLHINNALKDKNKRDIITSLRREKKYLTLIANETHESVAKTKYHLHELEKMGIIASMKLTREKFFLLTERGKLCFRAILIYYPRNNFQKIMSRLKYGTLKWKDPRRRVEQPLV
jgi:DNA-binding MarR family transcriptional regulator